MLFLSPGWKKLNMDKQKAILLFGFFLLKVSLFGQFIDGKVSFITSNNVYVKFGNTKDLNEGDTLFISDNGIWNPCLRIEQKSSISCVTSIIGSCTITMGESVAYFVKENKQTENLVQTDPESGKINEAAIIDEKVEDLMILNPEEKIAPKSFDPNIKGRISGSSYSSLPQDRDANHRMMYRFSLNANHINDSKFSFETYLNFRQNFLNKTEDPTRQTRFFRVYNMAFSYEVDSTMSVVLGRKINYKISSLGAIDGIQSEKLFGKYFVGAIVGSRPDFTDFSYNPSLFEYGVYTGINSTLSGRPSLTTVGLLEQRNHLAVDRRYVYLQHSGYLTKQLHFFTSAELDIYNNTLESSTLDNRLTNFYSSLRYRMSRRVDFTLSFDSRKRIIYYETLKTDIERLLDDDEARQGVRARINVKPLKNIFIGLSYSKRFQNSTQNLSDNYNGYLTFSNVFFKGNRISLNYNLNRSSYLQSSIISFRESFPLLSYKVSADFYYRLVDYNYVGSEFNTLQHYSGLNISYRPTRKLMLSALGEVSVFRGATNYRFNTKIIQRFGGR